MFKDEVKRFKFFICVNMILATLLGVYAQDITYYVIGDSLTRSPFLYCLSILTILSIVLFILTPILICRFVKKSSLDKKIFFPYLLGNILIGVLTSMFSIFVLIMSFG